MLLLKNADLYAPEHVGRSDILLGGGKILAVSKGLDFRVDGLEVYDLEGKILAPGLIDQHVHITGGGFYENIPRALPEHLAAEVNASAWQTPPIFRLLQEWGNVDGHEMYRTFNMGIGMVIIAAPAEAARIRAHLEAAGETVYEIGSVTKGAHDVTIKGGVLNA